MPAPTPITIRYGDDGLLGQAAATVGSYQGGLDRRDRAEASQSRAFSQDLAAFGASQNATLAAESQRQRALELQQAHDLLLKQQRTQQVQNALPGSGSGYMRMTSPLATSIRTAKQASIQTKLNGIDLDPSQRAVIDQLAADDNIPFEQTERVLDDVVRQHNTTTQRKQQEDQFKQRQADQQKRAAESEERFKAREAGINERFGQTQTNSASREQGVNDRFNANQGTKEAANQLRVISTRIKDIERTAGFDPNGDESQFAGNPGNMFGYGKVAPDPQGLAAFRQYKQLIQEYEQLATKPAPRVTSAAPGTKAGGVESLSDEELLNQLTK